MKKIEKPSAHNYTYSDGCTLKNKYGITDHLVLEKRCAHETAKAIINFRQEPLPDKFDSNYLKYIHKQLFQEVFEWAGHTRDIPFTFSDGTVAIMPTMARIGAKTYFTPSKDIQKRLKELDTTLVVKNNLQGVLRKDFCENAAELFAFLNHIHPFREGNGRTQRMFFERIAEAAGHTLDFSLVTRERMTMASVFAEENGNLGPMVRMFEDISDPERRLLLKGFVDYMKASGWSDIEKAVVVSEKEGRTYQGICRAISATSFVLESPKHYYVVCKKDHLTEKQLETLKLGERFRFTVPSLLIPKVGLPSLKDSEISRMVCEDTQIQEKREQIQHLSKLVYGNSEILNERMDRIIIDSSEGMKLIEQIEQAPESIARLSGFKILGIKSQTRACAEENMQKLSEAIEDYTYAAAYAKKEILQQHKTEQRRQEKSVEMPSENLQKLLSLPQEKQRDILSHSPKLQKELSTFMKKLHDRLSPDERQAINSNDYQKLSENIGISEHEARNVSDLIQKVGETHRLQLQVLRANRSQVMALTG